jgi:hypothetical protein
MPVGTSFATEPRGLFGLGMGSESINSVANMQDRFTHQIQVTEPRGQLKNALLLGEGGPTRGRVVPW